MSGTGSPTATAALALADGTVFHGRGLGAQGEAVGEICFNTAMSGYQEILTDPSYAGQIITFTFPHIGNVGTNDDDLESGTPAALGLVLRADVTEPSNWRAVQHLERWLERRGLIGIAGVDTRRLTRLLRTAGAQDGALVYTSEPEAIDEAQLIAKARAWPGLEGMDLAKEVSCRQVYDWTETAWDFGTGAYGTISAPRHHVVAVDYGAKRNILRSLASAGCRVTVVPATADAGSILAHEPDGIFLSNGPGDPAATGDYAVPVIQSLMASGLADLRHLPRPPVARARPRRGDEEDALRPSRRQSPGQGAQDRAGRDHEPEPWLRGDGRLAAARRHGHARLPLRRHAGGSRRR